MILSSLAYAVLHTITKALQHCTRYMYLIDVFSLSLGVGSIVVKNATASRRAGQRFTVTPYSCTNSYLRTTTYCMVLLYYIINACRVVGSVVAGPDTVGRDENIYITVNLVRGSNLTPGLLKTMA